MRQLFTINIQDDSKKSFTEDRVLTALTAQIENSLEVGWKKEDIILVSNYVFDIEGISNVHTELNGSCLTGSKLYGVKHVFDNNLDNGEIIWAHDLDVWQNTTLDLPQISDMALSTYSSPKKLNGGSQFWTNKAKDILDVILSEIKEGDKREEPAINKVLHSGKYEGRYTILNTTYNVGCSGYVPRMLSAEKPIRCVHMNPFNRISWETHALDRDGCGLVSVSERLEKLLRRHFILATKLSNKGKKRQAELTEYHEGRMNKYLGKAVKEEKKKEELKSPLCKECMYYQYATKSLMK